uniref:Uncharacterized protein n=1 Tax=Setaria viridis TaxID=4556 RepID=A0A4U6VTK0_SETVI|nr:hypothetical protein SEVIR_2G215966v2 [Setaria viridis]
MGLARAFEHRLQLDDDDMGAIAHAPSRAVSLARSHPFHTPAAPQKPPPAARTALPTPAAPMKMTPPAGVRFKRLMPQEVA